MARLVWEHRREPRDSRTLGAIALTMTEGYAWGPRLLPNGGVEFRLWGPAAKRVDVVIFGDAERVVPMVRDDHGWWSRKDARSGAETRYLFLIDGEHRVPDPASRFQPEGVHRPSEIVDTVLLDWSRDRDVRVSVQELVFYELHVGTFTPEGTFTAAIAHLDDLAELGITAVEIMPIAQAAGSRTWGYDGVLPYSPSNVYGTPDDLRRFICAAHERGLAVFLDVVYNHFGPEGNYLSLYAPQFFTQRHRTPWGDAIDYSSAGNEPVRQFAIDNACYWLREYHFDGLRLDATETIYDDRPLMVLEELETTVRKRVERRVFLVVENDDNKIELLHHGYDAQWNDDVHHALHVLLTGERNRYYRDFTDAPGRLFARALTSGYAFQGEISHFRGGRPRGAPCAKEPLTSFINFLQNHDQIGNRALGERITVLAPEQAVHAALAALLLAPSPPLFFMGEEWAASTPFLYFCDFEPWLAEQVRDGRRREYGPSTPDPSAPQTFQRSKLQWDERNDPAHRRVLDRYRELLAIRKREIVPRIAGVFGNEARYEKHGDRAFTATWTLRNGETLTLDANLNATPQPGFSERTVDRLIYATHDTFTGGVSPPWSARWNLSPT
jgi:maltooligosyltrehalose trehalohydrolase